VPIFRDGKISPGVTKRIHAREGPFTVNNDLLVGAQFGNKMLLTNAEFRDFFLRIEYRVVAADAEGEICFRYPSPLDKRPEGYSIGLVGNGVNVPKHAVFMSAKTSAIGQFGNLSEVSLNDWHTLEIQAKGNRFIVRFDGKYAYEFEDGKHASGCLGMEIRRPGVETRLLEYQPIYESSDEARAFEESSSTNISENKK